MTVDDAVVFTGRLASGALASFEVTRYATGRKNGLRIELNGSAGSLAFDLERLNELEFFDAGDPTARRPAGSAASSSPRRSHPYLSAWWPPGHTLGWEHTFTHQAADLLTAIADGGAAAARRSVTGWRCSGYSMRWRAAPRTGNSWESCDILPGARKHEGMLMARPFTLFTGQWADLPLEEVCRLASSWGYDGLEIACWGDHFEVDRALREDGYLAGRHALLDKYGLKCWAISAHLVGQAVCDHPIDERHQGILPARIWGDGDPEGVRRRAAAEIADTARAAAAFGVRTVIGFTGSSIWHTVAMFPPVPESMIERGLRGLRASAGTPSSTCSTPRACGSRTRCTRARSRTTSGRRTAPSRRWTAGRRSG